MDDNLGGIQKPIYQAMTNEFETGQLTDTTSVRPTKYELSSQLLAILASFQTEKKRDEYIKALEYLSKDEQEALKKRLDAAKSDVERWMIITQTVQRIQSSSKYQTTDNQLELQRKEQRNNLMLAVGAVLIGGAFIYIILKKVSWR